MAPTLIVGDLHGCHAELLDLLDVAGLPSDGRLVSVGDLVGRGPAPDEVVRIFEARPGAQAVLGNHEREHLLAARGPRTLTRSQRLLRVQVPPDRYQAMLAWFATLPTWLGLGEVLVVHGGWLPGVCLEEQPEEVLAGSAEGERRLAAACGGQPWYTLYDGDLPLVVGHRDHRRDGEPLVWRDRVFALDTGCVRGGRLTGLLLPEFRLVSVPSRDDHWGALKRLYGVGR